MNFFFFWDWNLWLTLGDSLSAPPLQLEKLSLPTSCFFPMECRRWAPMRSVTGSFLFSFVSGFFPFFTPVGSICLDCLG